MTIRAVFLLLLLGCASASTPPVDYAVKDEDLGPFASNCLKITYFRFFEEIAPGKDKVVRRVEPTYYVLVSDGWYKRFDFRTFEPFMKAFPQLVPCKGKLGDDEVRYYVAQLLKQNYLNLPAARVEDVDIEWLRRMRGERNWNQVAYIAVQTEKTYHLVSVFPFSNDPVRVRTFVNCERAAQQIMSNTLGVVITKGD